MHRVTIVFSRQDHTEDVHEQVFIGLLPIPTNHLPTVQIHSELSYLRVVNESNRTVRKKLNAANWVSRTPTTGPHLTEQNWTKMIGGICYLVE